MPISSSNPSPYSGLLNAKAPTVTHPHPQRPICRNTTQHQAVLVGHMTHRYPDVDCRDQIPFRRLHASFCLPDSVRNRPLKFSFVAVGEPSPGERIAILRIQIFRLRLIGVTVAPSADIKSRSVSSAASFSGMYPWRS